MLLRLDSALAAGSVTYDDHSTITVEHVLPQSPRSDSQWCSWFDDQQRQHWTHRLANLVLLTRRKNSQAGTLEFEAKKDTYFRTSDGVSPFPITTQVLREHAWTPDLLEQRQRQLVAKLTGLWKL